MEAATTRARPRLFVARLDPRDGVRAAVITALLLFVLIPLPGMLSSYWTDVLTSVTVYSVVALGLNLLMGRVGLVSLGQIARAGARQLGRRPDRVRRRRCRSRSCCWARGSVTMVLGTLVGLPALRLSGLYLALITLMLAGAITVVLRATNFPNGGPGFLGHTEDVRGNPAVRRPDIAVADAAYFRYAIVVGIILFLLALVARARAARARVGGDPPERAGGASPPA